MEGIQHAAALTCLLMLAYSSQATSDADWPMYRRDPRNSGDSPLQGNMDSAPEVLWTYFVGGYAAQAKPLDIDMDGRQEVLYVTAGKIRAVKSSGELIWVSPYLGTGISILDQADFGSDGSVEVVCCNPSPSAILLIDSQTGIVVWNYSFPSPASGVGRYCVKIADVFDGASGPELLVWPYKGEAGYAFSFPSGASSGEVLWTAEAPETRNYPPPIAVADLDLDGVQELVLATYEKIYSFDGKTGRQKMVAYSPGINRNYGTLVIKNLDQDPYPEILLLAPNLNEHLWVVDNDGLSLTQLWNKHFEYSYPQDLIEVKVTVDSVADVDGDALQEIVYSIFNKSSDSRWHTKVLDALTGEEEIDLPDEYLLTLVDLDGDGTEEIVMSEQHARPTLYYSNVTIRNIKQGRNIILRGCGLVMDYSAPYPLGINTIANMERWMRGDLGFLIRANGSVGFLSAMDGAPAIQWVLAEASVGASFSIAGVLEGDGIITGGNDGWLRLFDASGALVGRAAVGGYLAPLVAADLDSDGRPEVVVRNSTGQHLVLDSAGSKIGSFSAGTRRAKFGKDGSLVVWDMDGDSIPEIISGGATSIVILDASGTQVRSYPLPSEPYDWMVANITGDSCWDLFVCRLGTGTHTAHTLAIDGLSGRVLWTKDYGSYAGFVAVLDFDGDGLDDLLMREHFDLYIIDGLTGRVTKGDSLCGYHAPIVTDVDGDGDIEVVWGGGWGSLSVDRRYIAVISNITYVYTSQVWVKLFGGGDSNEIYGRMPAVADVDGDGVREIAVGNVNGTIHYFDGANGKLEWNFAVGSTPSDIVSCDIDSDGLAEYLFGCADGRLICLGPGRIEWFMDFADVVGDPIICDLDGDGRADLLVPVMDGNLYALHVAEALDALAAMLLVCLAFAPRVFPWVNDHPGPPSQ